MIRAIHTKIPGRARFKIKGLYDSESLKGALEKGLSKHKDVQHVSVSTITANILIIFNASLDYLVIVEYIEAILSSQNQEKINAPSLEQPESMQEKNIYPAVKEKVAILKKTVDKLLHHYEKQDILPWHTLKMEKVLSHLQTDLQSGLSNQIAKDRFEQYGPNLLPESKPRSKWKILMGQFFSLPVGLLALAAGISIFTGGVLDAVVIMGVVVANGLIGFITENEAEKTIQSLKSFIRPIAEVIREGRISHIPAEQLVVGDLLLLKPGSYVAADSRVIQANHLNVDESILTGESMPVMKGSRQIRLENTPISDRANMVFMGTLVTGGEGIAVVVATGTYTEMGRLKALLDETTAPETPIEKQLSRAGDQLVLICGAICGVVFVIGFIRGHGFLQMLKTAISLAAAAVPEGLPAAATINFSLGINNMRKHHVLIRQLQAIETLGAVQAVCLDKTGTLTKNQMSVLRVHTGLRKINIHGKKCRMETEPINPLDFQELKQLIYTCTLCNETKINGGNGKGDYVLSGSPTENALIRFAYDLGIDAKAVRNEYPLLQVSHRSENRLFMSTLHGTPENGNRFQAVKGSPPEVLGMCDTYLNEGEVIPMTEEIRLEIEMENERMAGEALRVLGVAYSILRPGEKKDQEEGLTWLGLIGMADPIRDGAKELIDVYHKAGIDTIMITGDQSPTAHAVAQRLNISGNDRPVILDSTELVALDTNVMEALAKEVHVYSRVSPAHKLRIVQALQSIGKVVAMTGDGINDGPALKAADIGIAMGQAGTDVAREVADVVLEKDDLETLIIAIRDGRTTYNNIRKSVHFFLSTNLSEIMVMFGAIAAGIGFPLNIMQLLWINIISDIFPGLALSMEAPEPDILEQKPRPSNESLFNANDFKRMVFESAVISTGAMGAYGFGILRYGIGAHATSLAFQGLTIGQLLHAFSCRSEKSNLLDMTGRPQNPYLNWAVGGSLALQILTMFLPGFRRFLGITPMTAIDVAVVAGSALVPLAINESTKNRTGLIK